MKSNWWIIGLSLVLLLAVISPLASKFPDGLDRFADDLGFADKATEPAIRVMPEYSFPGVENDVVATIIAALLGTIILFGIGFGLASILRSKHEA